MDWVRMSPKSSQWSTKQSKSPPKPIWDGSLDSFDPNKVYSGTGEAPEPISLKIASSMKRALAIAFDSGQTGVYETMSDLYRDAIAKGLHVILDTIQNEEAKIALAAYVRWCDSEALDKKLDTWRLAIERRRRQVENINSKTGLAAWVADCIDDAQYMEGNLQDEMYRLIDRYK